MLLLAHAMALQRLLQPLLQAEGHGVGLARQGPCTRVMWLQGATSSGPAQQDWAGTPPQLRLHRHRLLTWRQPQPLQPPQQQPLLP